nr:complement C1q tumor necrosis factor-related protein 6 [Meriones unguiculatus]
MGTASLGSLWAVLLLLLLSLVFGVPTEEPTFGGSMASKGCQRCCDPEDPLSPADTVRASASPPFPYVMPEVRPYINITILKGKVPHWAGCGQNRYGAHYSAFSVGGESFKNSSEDFLPLRFDRVFVNTDGHFDMATGHFVAPLRGLYFFSLNVHSWNYKETYVHIVHNDQAAVILYTQPSERSIMQSQSVMLPLVPGDHVWVRLFKRERENAIYSDDVDTYITFSGHLIKAEDS